MKKILRTLFTAVLVLSLIGFWTAIASAQEKISKPGVYSGYSLQLYDGWKRFSQYVTVRDGTKLAIDYYLPTVGDVVVNTPLPVLFQFTPYGRAIYYRDASGNVVGAWLEGEAHANGLAKYGYIIAVADVRGMGASYGFRATANDRIEAWDAHDIIEWLGDQPWCDGKVGTWGYSYYGQTQLEALSTAPSHLKASFIGVTDFDKYDGWSRNGVPRRSGAEVPPDPASEVLQFFPVDGDVDANNDGKPDQLWEAVQQHVNNGPFTGLVTTIPYRNSLSPYYLSGTKPYWEDCSARTYLPVFQETKVPVYIYAGWYDLFRRDSMTHYANWPGPVKMVAGPWRHGDDFYDDFYQPMVAMSIITECHRFFDYWLKGIQNGLMDEPPIYMNAMNTPVDGVPQKGKWQFASQWPLHTTKNVNYYLNAGPSGTASSVNDGKLNMVPPAGSTGKDDYIVDYDIKVNIEPLDVMTVAWGEGPNGTDFDKRGLTYTTEPLAADIVVTGHPLAELWVSSDNRDGDFMVFLEDVDPTGKSTYVTDGRLRASLRTVNTPPYNFLGLPWHRAYPEDEQLLTPGQPVQLTIDMMPTSYVFKAGNCIRFAIAGSQDRIYDLKRQNSPYAPTSVSIYRNSIQTSFVKLPVVSKPSGFSGKVKINTKGTKYEGDAEINVSPTAIYLNYDGNWLRWTTERYWQAGKTEHYKGSNDNGPIWVHIFPKGQESFQASTIGSGIQFKGQAAY